jgi:glycerol-3-phosphate dehydrogenase
MRRDLAALARERYDLVVVGGGITGAAIARDAALRGLRVALLEARDFSHATSSATSKLLHGGLRYLKTLDLGLVRESLAERRIWQRIAPHMVHPLPFILPLHEGLLTALAFHAGLSLYDLLAFHWPRAQESLEQLPAHAWLDRRDALQRVPALSESGLRHAFLYYDCQMLAPERLALECLADAGSHGAQLANYAEVTSLLREAEPSRICGVMVEDRMDGRSHAVHGELVVNATGPWADISLKQWNMDPGPVALSRSKGIHIITRPLTDGYALTLPIEGRHLFVLPWRGHSLIGTTDTPFEGPPGEIWPTRAELEGLVATLNRALPGAALTPADIRYAYAGVRPLIAARSSRSTYELSRRAEIVHHARHGGPSGLISVIGGKWTTTRRLAERAVDLAARQLGRSHNGARTAHTLLSSARMGRLLPFIARLRGSNPMLSEATIQHLVQSYGSRADDVLAMSERDRSLLERLAPELPQIGAEVAYAVEQEMALSLEDVVLRRIGLGTLGFPGEQALDRATAIMAARLGWDAKECRRQRASMQAHYDTRAYAKAALSA